MPFIFKMSLISTRSWRILPFRRRFFFFLRHFCPWLKMFPPRLKSSSLYLTRTGSRSLETRPDHPFCSSSPTPSPHHPVAYRPTGFLDPLDHMTTPAPLSISISCPHNLGRGPPILPHLICPPSSHSLFPPPPPPPISPSAHEPAKRPACRLGWGGDVDLHLDWVGGI